MSAAPRVFILGAGRAGVALARAFAAAGVPIVGLHGRHSSDVEIHITTPGVPVTVSVGALPSSLSTAEVVLVTVRDAQLNDALVELGTADLAPEAVILHASGSADPAALDVLRERGRKAGTFHPLVPLTGEANSSAILAQAWIGIDGDADACLAARKLASALGAKVMLIPAGQKVAYHAAAVMASNFPAVLAWLATERLIGAGVDQREAAAAVISLMHASVDNLRGSDAAATLTGPVVRGDVDTVRAHLDMLAREVHGDALAVYTALTNVAVQMALSQGADPKKLELIGTELCRRSSP